MATTVKVMAEQKRARYSLEYRTEALSLAERVGVAAAARELGLYATQIYQWRSKAAATRGECPAQAPTGWAGCTWQ